MTTDGPEQGSVGLGHRSAHRRGEVGGGRGVFARESTYLGEGGLVHGRVDEVCFG